MWSVSSEYCGWSTETDSVQGVYKRRRLSTKDMTRLITVFNYPNKPVFDGFILHTIKLNPYLPVISCYKTYRSYHVIIWNSRLNRKSKDVVSIKPIPSETSIISIINIRYLFKKASSVPGSSNQKTDSGRFG